MKKNVTLQLAASTLVLGLTVVGCKPAGTGFAPATASARAVKAEAEAAKIYAKAQAAVQKSDIPQALSLAERAVELSPRDVAYRMLLGDLYLKSGRFLSAENAFADVLTLDQSSSRATLSLALAQIAQGKVAQAIARLDTVAGTVPADAGLAYALAGQPQRAVELLEPAARAPGANGRVRQNLALAFAIAGDWQKARITAAQDLAPAEVGKRMEQWASFAKPGSTHLQVATLLGTSPVEDAGQPVRLALAPAAPEQAVYAEAEAPARAPQAPVFVAEAPAVIPVAAASQQTSESFAYQPPEQGNVFEAPAPVEMVEVPASEPTRPVKTISASQFAAAVSTLTETPAPVIKASAPVASAPVRAFVPQKQVRKARPTGRYVVQIGAYRSAAQVEKAWAQAIRRYRFAREPMSTTVAIPGKGTFHRLAIAGFETPAEAGERCGEIRAQGGTCFVRISAGDAPVQWASRHNIRRG